MSIKKILVLMIIMIIGTVATVSGTHTEFNDMGFDMVEINGYASFFCGEFSPPLQTCGGDLEVSILVHPDHDMIGATFDVYVKDTSIRQTIGPMDFAAGSYSTILTHLAVPSDFPEGEVIIRIENVHECGAHEYLDLPVVILGCSEPGAQLQIKSTTIVPETVAPKEMIHVTTVIENIGERSVADSDVDFAIEKYGIRKTARISLLPPGGHATIESVLEIPKDAEDGTEQLKVTLKYDNEEISKEYSFNVDSNDKSRDAAELKIGRAFLLDEVVRAGDMVEVLVNVENAGDRGLDDVEVTIGIMDMGFSRNVNFGDISGRDEKTQIIPLDIPFDALSGHYTIRITAISRDERRVLHRDIEII